MQASKPRSKKFPSGTTNGGISNGRSKPVKNNDMESHATAWLEAIKQAMVCVRNHSGTTTMSELEASLTYLHQMENLLASHPRNQWKYPPDVDPPAFSATKNAKSNNETSLTASPSSVIASPQHPNTMTSFSIMSTNPYAAFMDSDDDDDSDDEEEMKRADEGGDEIVVDYHPHPPAGGMDRLRLLVRLHASQSDVQRCMASCLVHNSEKEWTRAALCLQHAIMHARQSLEMADAQISKWYENRQDDYDLSLPYNGLMTVDAPQDAQARIKAQQSQQRQQDLMQDADIVHVCIQSLVDQRARYLQAAQREVSRLSRRLQPQWQARDEARRRMGGRWNNNPHPKNDYAERRKDDEATLRAVERAVEVLQTADDMRDLQESAELLLTRLATTTQQGGKKNRYNGQRPTDLSRRLRDFPDATEYDWIFTGSADNVVEFFEKTMLDGSLVKLDFYFTTGTVKTSLDHPTQGNTQLFAKKVKPDLYVQILENPRVHTNVRYKKKRKG